MYNNLKDKIKSLLVLIFSHWQKNHRQVAKKPSEVYLSITDDCCLRCKMCNIWQLKEKQTPLQLETAIKIIDKLKTWLDIFNLNFSGGEPFLNQDFLDIITYANKKGINTSTNSNAYVINQKLAKKIAISGLNQIYLSLDGLNKEHDYVRGKNGSYLKVVKAIKYLLAEKKRPKVFINTVISKNNLHQLDKIVKLAKNLKIDGISFQVLMPNFASQYQSDWYKNNPLWPKNKKQVNKEIEKLIKLKKELGKFILNSNFDLQNFKHFLTDPQKYQTKEVCFVGLNNVIVDTQGKLKLCYEMPAIGNLFKTNPKKIWIGNKAQQTRKKIAQCQRPCKLLPCNNFYFFHWLKNVFIPTQ